MKSRVFLILTMLVAGTCLALEPAEQAGVKRGEPQRAGNYWEERAECSAPVREGGRLVVRAEFGSLDVKPGANDRLACQVRLRAYTTDEAEAKRYLKNYELSLRQLESGTYLTGKFLQPHHGRMSLGAEFGITVPLRFSLDLETKGGEIKVEKLEGTLQASTAGGDVRTGDVTGSVRAETAGGDIRLGNIGAPVEARTAGGTIRVGDVKGDATLQTSGGEIVAGLVQGSLRAETAGGDLILRGASGPVEARTAGGQIQVGQSGGNVIARTAGGSIRLQGARGRVEVRTAGGSIDLLQMRNAMLAATAAGGILAQVDADLKKFAASELETSVGDVQVYLPAHLPVTVDAVIDMASGHKILSDFPLNVQKEGEPFVPTKIRAAGALNGGGEVLRIRTVAGNIEIRKLDPRTLEQLQRRQESFWKRWEERERQRGGKQQERGEGQKDVL
jgi:DUF4097 and DUF4098 domain-containing protein YvlB